MTGRSKNEGRIYLRRSDSKQESSLETQLQWGIGEATRLGMTLKASLSDLEHMLAAGLHHYRHIYLDNAISGADLKRPGLTEMVAEAQTNRKISHIFAYKRDRLGRPDNPLPMMVTENSLSTAGVTIVFCDGTVAPRRPGETDLSQIIHSLLGYHASGEYLKDLADRIILGHRNRALQGYRTGGNAPYGFVRVLVDPSGEVVEELPKGKVVRQEGYRVRIMPKDPDKIAVWVYILNLRLQGWGIKRIAQHLNELGIPSPGAGSVRTDQGVPHRVSGKWSPNTVSDLCRNQAILGIQEYGRRSEGAHRRLGQDGPRLLEESDRTASGKPRIIENPQPLRITAPAGFEPLYDPQKFQEIQERTAARAKSQKGIRRAKDPARYPLSGRVFDLTDGCGSLMYGTKNGKPLYKCGRYMRTSGAECQHNSVDAEALLRFTLQTLTQPLQLLGGREKLRQLLEQRAAGEEVPPDNTQAIRSSLELKISELQQSMETAAQRMAVESDQDRYEAIAQQFDKLKGQLQQAERELTRLLQSRQSAQQSDPDRDVEAALSLFDELERVITDTTARAQISPLLEKLGVRLGLTFTEVPKGPKRKVRQLLGGVMAFGGHPLPIPIHGANNCSGEHCQAAVAIPARDAGKLQSKNVNHADHGWPALGDKASKRSVSPGKNQQEGKSFTMVSRGERI